MFFFLKPLFWACLCKSGDPMRSSATDARCKKVRLPGKNLCRRRQDVRVITQQLWKCSHEVAPCLWTWRQLCLNPTEEETHFRGRLFHLQAVCEGITLHSWNTHSCGPSVRSFWMYWNMWNMMSSTCTASTKKRLSHWHSSEVNKDKKQSQSWLCYSQRPSSVRSTLMMKNMNPRAPSFCPPTSVFTQPSKQSHASSATGVCFKQEALRWDSQIALYYFALPLDFSSDNKLPGPSWPIRCPR